MTIPQTMQAIEISEPGGPGVLRPVTRPVPAPGKGEVLIRVAAAGVNRPDALQREGAYPPPPGASDIPGLEAAGEIVAGSGERWSVGDRVCALVTGGGYAEYAVAHQDCCLPVPDGLSELQAAALPETYFTVWSNVFDRARLQPGEVLLVHGGSSGIGTTAIQLGAAFGARVFATAGSAEKVAACETLGAERGINYREEDFVAVVREATGKRGANVILDMVGGDYVARNIRAAAVEARIVQIAFLQGSKVSVDLMPVMLKRLVLTGSTLRARDTGFKGAIAATLQRRVWPLLASGAVAPQIDATYPLAEAAAAHERLESSAHIGKIMLVP